MAHTELDLRERRLIEDMLYAKVPVSKIAAEIGRHRLTVYREIKRNSYSDEELPYLDGYWLLRDQRSTLCRRPAHPPSQADPVAKAARRRR